MEDMPEIAKPPEEPAQPTVPEPAAESAAPSPAVEPAVPPPVSLDHPVFVPTQEERAREAARRPRHWSDMTAEALIWIVLMVYGAAGVVWYLNRITNHL